jgi:hypothetical protein
MLPHGLTSRPTFSSDGRCTSARGKPCLTGYVSAGAGRRLTVSAKQDLNWNTYTLSGIERLENRADKQIMLIY